MNHGPTCRCDECEGRRTQPARIPWPGETRDAATPELFYSRAPLSGGVGAAGVPAMFHGTGHPICPYCAYEHRDSWEWGDCDGETVECDSCGKPFIATRYVSSMWTTKPAT
jgi:hypothetical protein